MQYRVGKKKLYTLGFIACGRGKFNYYTFSVVDCYSRAIVVAVFLPQLVINHLLGSSSIRMLRPILCFFEHCELLQRRVFDGKMDIIAECVMRNS